jgi:hypothetical protein
MLGGIGRASRHASNRELRGLTNFLLNLEKISNLVF